MTEPTDLQPVKLSHAAIWALKRLSQPRYGRSTPALSWSVTHELIRAGFVAVSENGRGHDAHPGRTQFSAWQDANLTLLLLLAVARTATWNARARLSIERSDINYCSESEQSIII